MELTKSDFIIIRDFIRNACGIILDDDKEYLVHQRLESLAQQQGCHTFGEFAVLIKALNDPSLRDKIVSAITTNETSFFRDNAPFELFRAGIMPDLVSRAVERKNRTFKRKGAKVSILSAGASTGQEPYSIAICIREYLQFHSLSGIVPQDFEIVAVDISSQVLAKAIAGEYTDLEVNRGLKNMQVAYYFNHESDLWAIKDEIKSIVEFRRVNLIEPFTHLGGFDLIFCRNVLIYFDIQTRKRIIDQFHQMLHPQGFLVLGITENMYGITDSFESNHMHSSVYYTRK